jgi:formylglycine-generating enzyme
MTTSSGFRTLRRPSRHRLGGIVVALFAALTVFATGAEPIAPGELVAPRFEIVGGNLNFTVQPSVAGRSYLLQYADKLHGGTWQDLGGVVIGDGNNLVLTTPRAAGVTRRFYRIALDTPAGVPEGFSLIPAGSFTMGRTIGDTDINAPPVTVTVSAFFMGKYEVTKALWDEVRTWGAANGYTDLRAGGGKASNHPVQTISWFDAVKWCNARSQREGLTPVYTVSGAVMKTGTQAPTANWSANGYRLPTEAEWEKAARGGVSRLRFPWGNTISHSQANYLASKDYPYDSSGAVNNYHPSYMAGGTPFTSPVGSFAANGYGLHDMAGNVWEWCWDWYEESTYVSGASDPRGAASGSDRVFRGGSWYSVAFGCRAALRYRDHPASSFTWFGFRLARTSVPEGFSFIPAGAFTMGRTSGDTDSDAPPVTVTMSAFFIGKHEVTKALWDEVRTWGAANGYTDLRVGGGKAGNHPVYGISWFDIVKWCNARSQRDGLNPVYTVSGAVMKTATGTPTANWSANGYRLPTEAEWEKAARGGVSGLRFPPGNTISHSQANYYASSGNGYDLSGAVNNYHPSYMAGGFPYTSPVGSFAANGYGLYDVAGNVWEWCWDYYGGSTYVSEAIDPRGAASGWYRVVRGGSWNYDASYCRAADRHYSTPAASFNNFGFRLARSSVP